MTTTVQYHGPAGDFHTNWPEGDHTKTPPKLVHFQDRLYDYAGTQDGAHHYKERVQ